MPKVANEISPRYTRGRYRARETSSKYFLLRCAECCTELTKQEIKALDKQTDGQQSDSIRVPFFVLGYGTLKISKNSVPNLIQSILSEMARNTICLSVRVDPSTALNDIGQMNAPTWANCQKLLKFVVTNERAAARASAVTRLSELVRVTGRRRRSLRTIQLPSARRIVDLLERIFRLFDVDRRGHLVQEDWVEFLKERLTEEKQIDFVEQVESVAYVLCGDGVIGLDKFFSLFKNKGHLSTASRVTAVISVTLRLVPLETQLHSCTVPAFLLSCTTLTCKEECDEKLSVTANTHPQVYQPWVCNSLASRRPTSPVQQMGFLAFSFRHFPVRYHAPHCRKSAQAPTPIPSVRSPTASVECKLMVLQVTNKLFRVVDSDGDGSVSADDLMEFLSAVSSSRSRSGFDKNSVEWLEQLFKQTVGDQKEITREQFQKIVVSKNPFFTERVFQIFDEDDSGAISLQEFIAAVYHFAGQTPDDKISFLFKVYDLDGDGLIQHRELQHVMRACMEENGMRFSEEQLLDLTSAMFEDADTEHRGAITYEALKHQLEKHGGLLENLSISIDRWLVPPKPQDEPKSLYKKFMKLKPYQLSVPYFKNNYVFVIYLTLFFLLNAGLFISRAIEYKESNGFVIVARACGQCLNFNCMWVLVLMLRQSITFLRTRGFSSLLPLDNHIYLHKLAGLLIFIYSLVHTIMHLCNFGFIVVNDPIVNKENYTLYDWLMTEKPGLFGLVGGCANPTGIALMVILIVMSVCSQPFIRRGGSFEIFYWTHLLYVPFWLLLIFHGPNFWKWFIIPGLIYIVERIIRLAFMRSERGKTYISSGILLPSRVTHLVIKRSVHFDFHPGDYVFVNIPAIATYEWHPFTISSAPEQEDYIWLHVRGVGEWTNRLYEYFEKEQIKLHAGEVANLNSSNDTSKHSQLDRTVSNQSNKSKKYSGAKKRSVDFSPVSYCNEGFSAEDGIISENEIREIASAKKKSPEKRKNFLAVPMKIPLEKSLSMPDMQTKMKKKERLRALREYMRSESEKSFDECEMRRAHLRSLGLAYKSPQNRSLAQSFRYMRTKPTIIAFKTPSLENCEQKPSSDSILTAARRRLSKSLSPDKDAELGSNSKESSSTPESNKDDSVAGKSFANYPVGKPLEIYLDGPYGAPSSHMFRAQHAVLIATGIGVTPFASILQSIMHRYWKARHTCPKCSHTWASDIPATVMHLRKASSRI
ncbi:NADPH oxidase 5 [Eumeta japonica]|uniref:NADPH oxidase 5 n=1 Tax=Eumeta variegata TaxID=151549 RepID=A0A4C1SQU3_EUMVA|nr:NADPH oxidase 5 [Eumeta japonica]